MSASGSLRDAEDRAGRPPPSRDEGRLRALARDHGHDVVRRLIRLGVPPSDAEDALQEALLVVAARLTELPAGADRPYLFATALRVASNARRGLRRRRRTHDELERLPQEAAPTADDLLGELERHRRIEEALDQVPDDSRLVFLLAELDDMPAARIAERLGIAGGTVASRLRRARRSLQQWSARVLAATRFEGERSLTAPAIVRAHKGESDPPEIVSWWVSRGEVDALSALLGVYRRTHPNDRVVSAPVFGGPVRAQEQLRTRLRRGLPPPDTFQVNGGSDVVSWARRGSSHDRLEPIDALFTSEGWTRAFPRELVDLVSHDGRAYSVPVDVHRTNVLYFNRALFAEHGLSAPASLEELHAVAGELQRRGVAPFAVSHRQGWSLRILAFETIFVALVGGPAYCEFFAGRSPFEEASVRVALAHLARILDYANADAGRLEWHEAVERVRSGQAAMTVMGDWARGYLWTTRPGGSPDDSLGETVGEVEGPGARGAFIFATDTFGLPRRAVHRDGAIELLKVIGSREGQDAFNPLKGSIPARIDADLSRYDASSRATAQAFRTSARYPVVSSLAPPLVVREIDAALIEFARTRNADVVVETLRIGLTRRLLA